MASSPSETIGDLARHLGGRIHRGDPAELVRDLSHDSRQVGPGWAFVAVRGFASDGHDFVDEAAGAGAAVAVVEHPVDAPIAQIVVADTRAALGPAAAVVYGRPSERLALIGVTGTNGKTSVTHFVESIGREAGRATGLIGTLGVRIGDAPIPTERTTPEASDLQRILARMLKAGVDLAVMEVSSHALSLGRVEGAHFAVAAFTNLSQDHLDFHGDMETYFLAKAQLFDPDRSDAAVVCVDDPWGSRLAELSRSRGLRTSTVAVERPAWMTAVVKSASMRGSEVEFVVEGEPPFAAHVPIPGRFSVANAAVAAASCLEMVGPGAVAAGLAATPPIPGRFEVVAAEPFGVVVDYSHTPAGIEAAIATARPLVSGRVIAVFGAGGDRDRGKRPMMGRAASAADVVIVTSDNPRSEDAAGIIRDIVPGVKTDHETIEDRRQAIARAIELAAPGDIVLIMGKGHETYQEIEGEKHPFDDRLVARHVLEEIGP